MAWTYEQSGVSIEGGNAWVGAIKALMGNEKDSRIVGGIGGFSGLFKVREDLYLAACCDGVGTKLEVGRDYGLLRGLGQDLVAMNVNDLVCCGATPLFFLDYLACGHLDVPAMSQVMEGVISACRSCGCALLGGETAEMPGVYPPEGFDLAGFSVGMVAPSELIDGKGVAEGDLLVGLASSGVHSNGFSLVRRALFKGGLDLDVRETPEGFDKPLGEVLLTPTRLYVNQALAALKTGKVRAMAHITGGGLEENIQRVVPAGLKVAVDFKAWERPAVFGLIASAGVEEKEMRKVFNLGIGFVFICSPSDLEELQDVLSLAGEEPRVIGKVVR